MEFTLVCDGVIPRACLDPMDGIALVIVLFMHNVAILLLPQCLLLILVRQCMCGIGSGASKDEKKQAMAYAHVSAATLWNTASISSSIQQYLQTTKHPLVPVTCLNEGSKNDEFDAILC